MKNTAHELTYEEIKVLPKASVIWMEINCISDDGIMWHSIEPALICVPGENGLLVGASIGAVIDKTINEELLEDQNITYWDREPDKEILCGISSEEYDLMEYGRINNSELATAITSRGLTFDHFSKAAGINTEILMEALTGTRELEQSEKRAIAKILELNPLKSRVIEKYGSIAGFSDIMNWSNKKTTRILNHHQSATAKEIEQMAEKLEISNARDFMKVFYPQNL